MTKNTEETLCNILVTAELSLQLKESTLPGNEALFLAYVRFVKDEMLVQKLLFARQLNQTLMESQYLMFLRNFFKDKKIPLSNHP